MLQAMLLSEPLITIADLQIDDDEDEDEDYLMLLRMYAMHNCCGLLTVDRSTGMRSM